MKCEGFSLIEIMVVVVLLAICATISTPVFVTWRVRDEVNARADALLVTLAYARNEAIRRKTRVTVCRVDTAGNCLASGKACPSGAVDWSCGWAVTAEVAGALRLLRVKPALDEIGVAAPLGSITFTPPAGQAIGVMRDFEVAPRIVSAATSGAAWRRCIRIAAGGRARISDGACKASS
ncbi:GspH/FimT family pseudopilin [Paraburkholderia adhaesiva]|uniref:GspH/FimT family pseudopilin n=1 Tax=Paraburkholderia adhaesiva TaxID=2883244 RepID=UPI001F46B2A5|nr:GspH/FimT family pseudopilin [Paraburkholderia adhaesiva]